MTTDVRSSCASCGMPLRAPRDHALGDPASPYCVHCADASGQLKSYEDVRAGMIAFLQRTQGVAAGPAEAMATRMMADQPAWRDRG